jgi:hypothetical protein
MRKIVALVFALPRQEARGRETGDGAREELGFEREVVQTPGVLAARQSVEARLDALEVGGLTDVARHVVDVRRELLEAGTLLHGHRRAELRAPALVALRASRDTHDLEAPFG